MILMIDNYDSFTFNLVRYLEILGEKVLVKKNDEITIEEIINLKPEAIVLSPGPKHPRDAKICLDVVRMLGNKIPIFGVCLGHQVIGYVNGCKIVESQTPTHGKLDTVHLVNQNQLTLDMPKQFTVTRYHSLHVINNEKLINIGQNIDGISMINQVKDECTYSVQYHPESFQTEYGMQILQNFLKLAKEWNVQKNRH